MAPFRRPRVLISNDDGVTAPGLVSLASGLHAADFCDFWVCGPSGERSAQSHSISLRKEMHAFPISVEGAVEAYAVDGTPADSVMLAIHSSLLQCREWDLVVSGINRGDNCGLHVIYSGTVGAAREAACKGLPAVALSLDAFQARSPEQYSEATRFSVALIRALLQPAACGAKGAASANGGGTAKPAYPALVHFSGALLNVNIPWPRDGPVRGYRLAPQGMHCHLPCFDEIPAPPGAAESYVHMGDITLRTFKNRIKSQQTYGGRGERRGGARAGRALGATGGKEGMAMRRWWGCQGKGVAVHAHPTERTVVIDRPTASSPPVQGQLGGYGRVGCEAGLGRGDADLAPLRHPSHARGRRGAHRGGPHPQSDLPPPRRRRRSRRRQHRPGRRRRRAARRRTRPTLAMAVRRWASRGDSPCGGSRQAIQTVADTGRGPRRNPPPPASV